MIVNQQPKCAIFFLQDHVSTKINTFTYYRGVGSLCPRNVKMEAFPFLHQILHTRRVDSPLIMWIQIRARGPVLAGSPKKFH